MTSSLDLARRKGGAEGQGRGRGRGNGVSKQKSNKEKDELEEAKPATTVARGDQRGEGLD